MKFDHEVLCFSECDFFGGSEHNLFSVLNYQKKYTTDFRYKVLIPENQDYLEGVKEFGYDISAVVQMSYLLSDRSFRFLRSLKFGNIIYQVCRLLFLIPISIYLLIRFSVTIKKFKPDSVIVNSGGFPASLTGRVFCISARICRVKKILFICNNKPVFYSRASRFIDILIDLIFFVSVDQIVTGSRYNRRVFGPFSNVFGFSVTNVPNGINIDRFDGHLPSVKHINPMNGATLLPKISRNRMLRIGMVGLFEERKGHLFLLDAIDRLRDVIGFGLDTKVRFLLDVNRDGHDDLSSFVTQRNLEDVVELCESSHIYSFYSNIDCLVFPSVYGEDLPNVISEAMALGKIVLASRVAGTVEQIIDGKTGFLFNAGDENDFIAAFRRLFEIWVAESNCFELMRSAGVKRFQRRFSRVVAVEQYRELLSW